MVKAIFYKSGQYENLIPLCQAKRVFRKESRISIEYFDGSIKAFDFVNFVTCKKCFDSLMSNERVVEFPENIEVVNIFHGTELAVGND